MPPLKNVQKLDHLPNCSFKNEAQVEEPVLYQYHIAPNITQWTYNVLTEGKVPSNNASSNFNAAAVCQNLIDQGSVAKICTVPLIPNKAVKQAG